MLRRNFENRLSRFEFVLNPSSESPALVQAFLGFYYGTSLMHVFYNSNFDWFSECEVLHFRTNTALTERLNTIDAFPHVKEILTYGRSENSMPAIMMRMGSLKSVHSFVNSQYILNLTTLNNWEINCEKISYRCVKHFPLTIIENNFSDLVHLCLPPCILKDSSGVNFEMLGCHIHIDIVFDKEKQIFLNRQENGAFNIVLTTCLNIKVLEIALFNDAQAMGHREGEVTYWRCLINIRNLTNLTHLTLEQIPLDCGDMFRPIAEGCPLIEYFRLKEIGSYAECVYMEGLCEALLLMRNLRSFRLEGNQLYPGTNLFNTLRRCNKLERMALFFNKSETCFIDKQSIKSCIQDKEYLLFAYIKFHGISKRELMLLTEEISTPDYLFLQICNEDSDIPHENIPLKHLLEMVQYAPWIAAD